LGSLPALARHHGVTAVTAVLATHYHDDHVAGMNLLRTITGAQVWAPENVAPVLENPQQMDLPCQWYDPTPVDRVLRFDEPVRWNEYMITTHPLPGHTRYAGAFEFEVDGVKVLATGDQQDGLGLPGIRRDLLNYQYRNQFRYHDYEASAALYRRVAPGLMIAGHWQPRQCDADYFDRLALAGQMVVAHHRALLPLDDLDLPADGVLARLMPYETCVRPGDPVIWRVWLHNPCAVPVEAVVRLVVPTPWQGETEARVHVPARCDSAIEMTATATQPPPSRPTRAVVAVDVRLGSLDGSGALDLGQHAEALVTVLP